MNDREPRDDQLALFGGGDPPERRGQLARDAAARRTAQTELERPLLVEAGAGTGKTTTLTARILAWCLGPGWEAAGERVAAREAAARPLAAPAPPDEDAVAADVLSRVVAITFTEAAAAEMASRVGTALAALTGHQEPPPWILPEALPADPPERSRRARALLGALDHLVVRTIHAFCRSLLAAHPLEAGLHPELRVDPDGLEVEAIVREVVEDRLREAYGGIGPDGPDGAAEPAAGDPDLLALAGAGIGPAELAEALVSALVHENLRPEDLESSPFAPGRVRELREGLQEAVRRFEEAAGGRLDGLSRSKKTGEALEALRVTASRADEPADGGDGFEAFCRLCSELAETWGGRLRDRLKDWSRGAFNKTEADALAGEAGPEPVVRAAGALLARLDALRRLRPELLERSRRALAPMLAAARREMRVRGLATFHDLLTEARDLLTRRPDVAGSVRRRIDQLLVDELQDTDRLQVEVITAIGLPDPAGPDAPDAGRPGLFLVGDPKQSIYGWRNADLRAYAALRERVRAAGGETVTLAENFRSVPAILDEVGRAVEPVMIEESGVQPRFEPLVACERLAEEPGFARGRWAPVEYWVSWLPEAEGDGARPGLAATRSGDATLLEAEAIARDLAHLHREEGVPWHHAALLLRSFSDLDDYLEALRREGVPFAVTGDRQYYRRREVIDAAALVRSVIDPGDHLALLTVLRSPAVGVPDAALIPLWREGFPRAMTDLVGPDPESLEALRDAVARAAERMPTASSGKGSVPGLDRVAGWDRALLAAVDALARLRESFARDPADRFVERLRSLVPLELMASARHLGSYRLANLDRFFRRLTEAMESSAGDVTAILRALRRGVSEALEEEEGRPAGAGETEDAVQVMTIHKAKGLDFGHVYLAQLHKGS
ncbi:MAG: UvrD-helicase domain-containing protein, partial [Acidobacteriota bacterium]